MPVAPVPSSLRIPLALGLGLLIAAAGCTGSGSAGTPATTGSGAPAATPVSSAADATALPLTSPSELPASAGPHWTYVALGDSNTYGDPGDCHDCTTYPSRWATQITADTGTPVELHDLSQHNHLTTDVLLRQIKGNEAIGRPSEPVGDEIARADIITIAVGENDMPWHANPWPGADSCFPDYGSTCLRTARTDYASNLEGVLAEIDRLRAGKPTLIRLLNLFNDALDDTSDGPIFDAAAVSQVPAIIDALNAVVASEAARHHALVVDVFHLVNGPKGASIADPFMGLGDGSSGDFNDRAHVLIAGALAKLGYAPLR